MTDKRITSFTGEYRWLSNFWPSRIPFEGIRYPTVEHAYQAAKTTNIEHRKIIANLDTPGQAKRAGGRIEVRPDWDKLKVGVMTDLVHRKFTVHPHLKALLLETGDVELVEGNSWGDRFWGVCDGRGENHLGRILMEVRALLQKVPS